jgi:hypothetical protein
VAPVRRLGLPGRKFALVLLVLLALPTAAHRAPGSLSTIDWNEATGRTEIIHRLHSHDAELGVGEVLRLPQLSVQTIEGRAHIALYAEERFGIEAESGALPLELVGAELAGDYLLVYQEWPGRLPARIRLRNDLLRDVFPEQVNQLNINDGGSVRTLVFAGDTEWLAFEFGATAP